MSPPRTNPWRTGRYRSGTPLRDHSPRPRCRRVTDRHCPGIPAAPGSAPPRNPTQRRSVHPGHSARSAHSCSRQYTPRCGRFHPCGTPSPEGTSPQRRCRRHMRSPRSAPSGSTPWSPASRQRARSSRPGSAGPARSSRPGRPAPRRPRARRPVPDRMRSPDRWWPDTGPPHRSAPRGMPRPCRGPAAPAARSPRTRPARSGPPTARRSERTSWQAPRPVRRRQLQLGRLGQDDSRHHPCRHRQPHSTHHQGPLREGA